MEEIRRKIKYGAVISIVVLVYAVAFLAMINGVMGFLVGVTPLDHLRNPNIECK